MNTSDNLPVTMDCNDNIFGLKPPRTLEAIRLDRKRQRRNLEYRRLLALDAQCRRLAAERRRWLGATKMPAEQEKPVYGSFPPQGDQSGAVTSPTAKSSLNT